MHPLFQIYYDYILVLAYKNKYICIHSMYGDIHREVHMWESQQGGAELWWQSYVLPSHT